MYCPRTLETYFRQAQEQFPVLLVTGPRQVGKTTFLRHLSAGKRAYVSLDDPTLRNLAQEDPGLFLQRFRPPILIDEIQYAPKLLPFIKMAVDNQHIPGHFWLTGSQQFHLMKGVSESLAGRVGILRLLGLSQREMAGMAGAPPFLPTPEHIDKRMKRHKPATLQELYARIWRGSFPAFVLAPDGDRELFYSSYLQTYLQRDIRDLANVGNEAAFLKFLRAAAARTAQLLNLSELARDADVAVGTAKNWLSVLQSSGIVYLLEPFHSNVTKRLVKRPKLFFLDTGLCAYLTEWSSPQTLEAGAMAGPILETWILGELLKGYWHNGLRAPFHFYRDKDQKEIDLLIFKDDTLYPLEFKKTGAPSRSSIRHFGLLERLKPAVGPGALICLAPTNLPLTPKAQAVPASAL